MTGQDANQAAVQAILDSHPGLGKFGGDDPAGRDELARPDSVTEIEAAAEWVSANLTRCKTPASSSYALKHVYEHATGLYTTNGQFIVAMLLAGFPADLLDRRNPLFAVSQRSINKVWYAA